MIALAETALQTVPQLLLAIGIFLLMVGAYALGRSAQRFRRSKAAARGDTTEDDIRSAFEGFVVSAVLGLLALLLGFTFSMAVDRYDKRFELGMEEANAISSAYLLVQTFEEPYQSRIRTIISDYAENSLQIAQSGGQDQTDALLAEREKMRSCLWATSLAAVGTLRDDVSSNFLDKTREVTDVSASRVAVRLWKIPTRVYVVLVVYGIVTGFVMGFAYAGARGHFAAAALFGLATMSIMLIIDLDRPTGGRIVESEQPMLDVITRIRADPPANYKEFLPRQVGSPQTDANSPLRSADEARLCQYRDQRKNAR